MDKEFQWSDEFVAEVSREILEQNRRAEKWSDVDCPKYIIEDFKSQHMAKEKYPEGILSFDLKGYAVYYENIKHTTPFISYQQWCKNHLENEKSTIHSVINNSNETLTVGDETNQGIIERFCISNGETVYLGVNMNGGQFFSIAQVHPKPEQSAVQYSIQGELLSVTASERGHSLLSEKINKRIIFEQNFEAKQIYYTEDRLQIKEGDGCWTLSENLFMGATFFAPSGGSFSKQAQDNGLKLFMLKENADKYCEDHNPKFSKAQIREAMEHTAGSSKIPIYKGVIDLKKLGLWAWKK